MTYWRLRGGRGQGLLDLDRHAALPLHGFEFLIDGVAAELGELGFEPSSLPTALASSPKAFAVASSLATDFSKLQVCESVVGLPYPGQRFGNFALRHGRVLARDERVGGAFAIVDLVLEIGDLLLQRLAGLAGRIDRGLQRGDLLVGLGFAGERLFGEIFVAGVERLTGAVFPFLRLLDVLLIFGVELIVIAHGAGRSAHDVVQLVLHVGNGLADGGLEGGVFDGVHALVGLAARHASGAVEDV